MATVMDPGCNAYPNQHMDSPAAFLPPGTVINVIPGQRIKVGTRYVVSYRSVDDVILWVYEDLLSFH